MTQKVANGIFAAVPLIMLFIIVCVSLIVYSQIGRLDPGTYARVLTTIMLVVMNALAAIFFIRESWTTLRR